MKSLHVSRTHARWMGIAMAGLFALATAGCSETMTYVPRTAAMADPLHQLEDVVNIAEAPPLRVEVTDTYLKLIYAGESGPVTTLVRFSKVSSTKLLKGKGLWSGRYAVQVLDASGDPFFQFGSKDLETAQRFIDALTAACARAPKTA